MCAIWQDKEATMRHVLFVWHLPGGDIPIDVGLAVVVVAIVAVGAIAVYANWIRR